MGMCGGASFALRSKGSELVDTMSCITRSEGCRNRVGTTGAAEKIHPKKETPVIATNSVCQFAQLARSQTGKLDTLGLSLNRKAVRGSFNLA